MSFGGTLFIPSTITNKIFGYYFIKYHLDIRFLWTVKKSIVLGMKNMFIGIIISLY